MHHPLRTVGLSVIVALAAFLLPAARVVAQVPFLRWEAIDLLVSADATLHRRAMEIARESVLPTVFPDVDVRDPRAAVILTAFEAGLVSGDGSTAFFRPNDPITVEEAVSILARYAASRDTETRAVLHANGTGEDWFAPAVRAAIHRDIPFPYPLALGTEISRSTFLAMGRPLGIGSQPVLLVADLLFSPVAIPSILPASIPSPTYMVQADARQTTEAEANVVWTPEPESETTSLPFAEVSSPQAQEFIRAQPEPLVDEAPAPYDFRISLPTLGIANLPVTHPSDPFTQRGLLAVLHQGVGHLFSYPGSGGKIFVYGHSSSWPWDTSEYTKIFRRINELQIGDRVTVEYGGKTLQYAVTAKESVLAGDLSAYRDGGDGEELILYTCWPPDSITRRYVVRARPL